MFRSIVALLLLLAAAAAHSQAGLPLPPEQPIRLGRFPAASPDGSRLCFSYQGSLWTVPAAGGAATRLTANDSTDLNPHWSPDGNWIAFNSDREGGNQVFLIPAVGGPARQFTFHSAGTLVHDWFPDGRTLLVTTFRDTRRQAIYRLDAVTGAFKKLLEDDSKCLYPALSPDGKWLAYTRGALVDIIRKGYRGSANYDIYVAPVDGSAPPRRLTDSDRNDMWPQWGADNRTVYFTSERDGLATVWRQSREGGSPTRVVSSPPDAVRYLSLARNGSLLAYEAESRLWTARPGETGAGKELSILCRTDERGPRATYRTFTNNGVTQFALSRDGKRAAVVIRGDLFAVSTSGGGEAKRLTDNPTRDGSAAWAPDGKSLVYSSNRDGGWRLYSVDLATRETKQLTKGPGMDDDPQFSPDGKWIAFRRGPQTGLYVIRPDGTGEQMVVPGPRVGDFRWSPDGRWIACDRGDDIRNDDVWLVSVTPTDQGLTVGTPLNVTDHPGFNDAPQWLSDGSKVLFRSNRYRNRDIETINHTGRFALYSLPLEREKEKLDEDPDAPKPAAMPEKPKGEVRVDTHEIERRAKQVVSPDEGLNTYAVSPDGKTVVFTARTLGQSDLWQTSTEGGSVQRLTTGGESPRSIQWAPDSSRFYYLDRSGALRWLPKGGGSGGTVAFTARMEIERTVDYRAAFDEAWQTMNDRFYDRTFRGLDWKGVGEKYRSLLEHVGTRSDFNYLVTQMLGELNASHTGISSAGGEVRQSGYLGIWLDEEYAGPGVRVASVLVRSPADRDESRLKPGDHILAIDGTDIQPGSAYDRALLDKTGRTVTMLVNDKPEKEGARTVRIKPISRGAWSDLMYEKWLDERRAYTDRASHGRLAYIHVSDMGDTARNRFERELFSAGRRKEGVVLDLRNNNGGDTHDSLLRILQRNRHYFTMSPRTEAPFPQPERAYTKPVILLINEFSLSDAEVFANGFRELKLGKIIGTPTMGWIIFTSGTTLIDGSSLRVPHIGCYTLDGRDMENWGVPPDIRVGNTPADFQADRDPQLDRAIKEILR